MAHLSELLAWCSRSAVNMSYPSTLIGPAPVPSAFYETILFRNAFRKMFVCVDYASFSGPIEVKRQNSFNHFPDRWYFLSLILFHCYSRFLLLTPPMRLYYFHVPYFLVTAVTYGNSTEEWVLAILKERWRSVIFLICVWLERTFSLTNDFSNLFARQS